MPTRKELLNQQTVVIEKLEKDMKNVLKNIQALAEAQLLVMQAVEALSPKAKKGLKQ